MPGDPSETPYTAVDIAFTKLFASIIHSTVWREEMHVKIVWITLLAMANPRGIVIASVPGLADAARVSLAQCVEALEKLAAPDPWSRTKRHEGRRIQAFEGGWLIINYLDHRNRRNAEQRRLQTREAVRRYRERKADALTVSNVSSGKRGKPGKAQAEAEAEAEAEPEAEKSKAKSKAISRAPTDTQFDLAWAQYPKRAGSNPRVDAERCWRARLTEGIPPDVMLAGTARYAKFCEQTGKLGSEYVMQARRFYGPAHPFEESWAIPVDPDAWKHDPTAFRPGESQEAYIRRVTGGNGR